MLHTLQELTIYEADKLDRQMEKLGEAKDSGEWFIYIQRLYAPVWVWRNLGYAGRFPLAFHSKGLPYK